MTNMRNGWKTAAAAALVLAIGCAGDIENSDDHQAAESSPQEQALASRFSGSRWHRDAGTTTTSTSTSTVPPSTPTSTVSTSTTTSAPTATTTAAQGTAVTSNLSAPLGGPSGYTKLILNDVFGSARAGANITSLSNFNPGTGYGVNGTGWDSWMHYWNARNQYANATMASDHLELAPTGGPASVIVSHLEVLPTTTQSYYIEVKAATGRGAYNNGATSWPCIFLYAGNESSGSDQGSEIDIMETYTDLAFGTSKDGSGLYTQYFTTTVHNTPSHTQIGGPWAFPTPGIDVTTSFNTYGVELTSVNGQIMWNVYFNGQLVKSAPSTVQWMSTPPAIVIGWNPGQSPNTNAVMKLDSVHVWTK